MSAKMSAEWWEAEARRYCELHIASHHKLTAAQAALNGRRHDYVPLSVREGDWRKRFGWRLKGWREQMAFRLAPWLRSAAAIAERETRRATQR